MSLFRKSSNAIEDMSDRELLLAIYKEVLELKERFDDFEENGGGGETAELKKEIKNNSAFMQQLVLQSLEVVRDKAAKPSATEAYLTAKKEREEKEKADAEAAKAKALARRNGENKITV